MSASDLELFNSFLEWKAKHTTTEPTQAQEESLSTSTQVSDIDVASAELSTSTSTAASVQNTSASEGCSTDCHDFTADDYLSKGVDGKKAAKKKFRVSLELQVDHKIGMYCVLAILFDVCSIL